MVVIEIKDQEDFRTYIKSQHLSVIHFYANWATQCGPMNEALEELSKQAAYKNVQFGKCEAERLPEVSLQYKVAAVPTFMLFKNGNHLETVNGANTVELTRKINNYEGTKVEPPSVTNPQGELLEERLKSLINLGEVMVFMKGNPTTPRCGFSRTLVGILNETGVPYKTFDILSDEEVRQGLKKFSNWPTYPQVYVKGELVGGLDIIQELKDQGELVSTLAPK